MLIPLLVLAALPQSQHVRPPVRVDSSNPGEIGHAAADLEDRMTAVLWTDDGLGAEHVYAARSIDGGKSFGSIARVDQDASGAAKQLDESAVRLAGGTAYACWRDRRNGGDDLYFAFSRDGGATWSPELRLDDGHGPGAASVERYRLVADAPTGLVAVLMLVRGGPAGDELRLLASTDRGLSFGAPLLLRQGGASGGIDLDFDDGSLHAVWQDDLANPGFLEPLYQRSEDLGASWLPSPVQLAPGMMTDPYGLRVRAHGDRVAVVWQEISALCAIAVNLSSDRGAQWLPSPRRVAGSISPACRPQRPRLHWSPQHLLVAWADDRVGSGIQQPWLAWTDDFAVTWTEQQLFPTYGVEPVIHGDPDRGGFAVQWNGASQIYAVVSRSATPDPQQVFVVDTGAGLRQVRLRRDAAYDDLLSVWIEEDSAGQDHLWAAGFRAANVVPRGSFSAGGQVHFEAFQFPHHEYGWGFQVGLSFAPGKAPLPFGDGRSIGLLDDPLYLNSAGHPALRGVLAPDGSGATPVSVFPPSIPPGTQLWMAAVSFAPAPLRFGTITDARAVITF